MDKKSKILLWTLSLLIIASIGVTFWRIMIQKDYIIEAQADCDPTVEKCFVYHCDPEAEECTGIDEEDTSYFKKVSRVAANIPLCDPADENCQPWECGEGEKDCDVTFCDEQTKTEEDECTEPEQYNIDHPADAEEADSEEAVCEEGDEECLAAQENEGGDATCDPEQDPTCTVDESVDGKEGITENSVTNDGSKVGNSSIVESQQ